MTPAWIAAIVAVVVCLIGIGTHAVATAWWAAKVTMTLVNLGDDLKGFATKYEKQLEKYLEERYTRLDAKEDHAKRDELISMMWKKFDTLRDEIVIVRNKIDNHLENKNKKGEI